MADKDRPIEDVDIEDVDPKDNLQSVKGAQAASAAEHATTFKQALRESWKAALWSAVISLTIVMEGYDQRLVASVTLLQSFPSAYIRSTLA